MIKEKRIPNLYTIDEKRRMVISLLESLQDNESFLYDYPCSLMKIQLKSLILLLQRPNKLLDLHPDYKACSEPDSPLTKIFSSLLYLPKFQEFKNMTSDKLIKEFERGRLYKVYKQNTFENLFPITLRSESLIEDLLIRQNEAFNQFTSSNFEILEIKNITIFDFTLDTVDLRNTRAFSIFSSRLGSREYQINIGFKSPNEFMIKSSRDFKMPTDLSGRNSQIYLYSYDFRVNNLEDYHYQIKSTINTKENNRDMVVWVPAAETYYFFLKDTKKLKFLGPHNTLVKSKLLWPKSKHKKSWQISMKILSDSRMVLCDGDMLYIAKIGKNRGGKFERISITKKKKQILDIEVDKKNDIVYMIFIDGSLHKYNTKTQKQEKIVDLNRYGAHFGYISICQDCPEFILVEIINQVSKQNDFLVEKMLVKVDKDNSTDDVAVYNMDSQEFNDDLNHAIPYPYFLRRNQSAIVYSWLGGFPLIFDNHYSRGMNTIKVLAPCIGVDSSASKRRFNTIKTMTFGGDITAVYGMEGGYFFYVEGNEKIGRVKII